MSSDWLKNLVGASLSDDQMRRIPHSTTELGVHVTIKTVQTFGLLGTVLVGPLTAAIRADTRNLPGVMQKMESCGRGGLVLGLLTGPLMTYMAIRKEEEERIYDRCYRLRYNRAQVRVDQASAICAAGGTGIAMAYGGSAMFGGLVGMSSGILLAAFYNNFM